jgi:Cu-Zn family superoxide dismutase
MSIQSQQNNPAKTSRQPSRLFILVAAAAALAGCVDNPLASQGPFATARLHPTQGSSVEGELRFTQVGDRVRVTGEIKGLAPNTEHGFHVHEKGDCSSPDGMSAGGHYNPAGAGHGSHGSGVSHAGDLPSLRADANGVALVYFESKQFSVGGAADVTGRGLIVHRDPDDFKTQPTGNSGPRLACGAITQG